MNLDWWLSRRHRGKPPWITGRHKTRGGRDQDRWRGVNERFHVFVNGREVDYQCGCDGSLTLTINEDCDFCKGGA